MVSSEQMSDTVSCCSVDVLLYDRIPSVLQCPVLSITSCSSMPEEYKRVAAVALKEWFALNPLIPACLHIEATALESLFRRLVYKKTSKCRMVLPRV